MLYLGADDLCTALPMPALVEAMKGAFAAYSLGQTSMF